MFILIISCSFYLFSPCVMTSRSVVFACRGGGGGWWGYVTKNVWLQHWLDGYIIALPYDPEGCWEGGHDAEVKRSSQDSCDSKIMMINNYVNKEEVNKMDMNKESAASFELFPHGLDYINNIKQETPPNQP